MYQGGFDLEDKRVNGHSSRATASPHGVWVLFCLISGVASARPISAQTYVPTSDLEHPKIKYEDSLVSLNDRCPVRHGKLNPTYVPVYVNGRPVGFC